MTVRKFPQLIRDKQISSKALRKSRELFAKVKQPAVAFLHAFLRDAYALCEAEKQQRQSRSRNFLVNAVPTAGPSEEHSETPRFLEDSFDVFPDSFFDFLKTKLSEGWTRAEAVAHKERWIKGYLDEGWPVPHFDQFLTAANSKFAELVDELLSDSDAFSVTDLADDVNGL